MSEVRSSLANSRNGAKGEDRIMPWAALYPCSYPGCPNLVKNGYRCELHAKQEQHQYDQERGSSSQRGYGARWRRLRKLFLASNPLCVDCLEEHIIRSATEVDHILPKSQGGADDWDNLQALCKSHHSQKTARKDGRWGTPSMAGVG